MTIRMTIKMMAVALALAGCGDGKSKSQHFAECQMKSNLLETCMAAAGYVYVETAQCSPHYANCYWDENVAAVKGIVADPESAIKKTAKDWGLEP